MKQGIQSNGNSTALLKKSSKEQDFEYVIAPLTEAEFYSDFYEKKVCRIHRNQADYYKNLLSVELLDEVLHSHPLSYPNAKLVNASKESPPNPESYTTAGNNIIHKAKFLKQFSEGSTMVFSALHDHLPSLNLFCNTMSQYFSHDFQTNIYCTPPDAQGFHTHYDTHDVFILQIEGSKKWRIYESPLVLPLKTQPFDDQKPGKIVEEFILNAGDMLYVPRGIMHDAVSNNVTSMHITAGLLAYSWSEFLIEAILHLSKKDEGFRRNLPVGFGYNPKGSDAKDTLQKLLDSLVKNINVEKGFDRFFKELISNDNPNFPGQLRQVMSLSDLSIDSEIRKLPNVNYEVSANSKKILIHLYGQELEFPTFTEPAVAFLEQNDSFKVADLPDCMDDAGKIVFVKRLVKEGLLNVL